MDNRENNQDGAAQGAGGIYSTPDLTVDTQKIAPTPASDEDVRARVSSAFANTDASRQAEQFNNMMNGAVASQPATEDIRIDNGGRKKKWPIVLAIVAVLVVVGGVVVMGAMGTPSREPETPKISLQEAKDKFSQYATYLLFGKSENELAGNFDATNIYTVDRELENPESNEYWTTAKKMLSEAIETYSEVEDRSESLLDSMKSYLNVFTFIDAYRTVTDPTDDDIIAAYLEAGKDGVETLVDNAYRVLEISSGSAVSYLEARKNQYGAMVDVLELYTEGGCIIDGAVGTECASELSIAQSDLMDELTARMNEAELTATTIVEQSVSNLKANCWRIYTRFYGDAVQDTGE